jgi:hypothetical protein
MNPDVQPRTQATVEAVETDTDTLVDGDGTYVPPMLLLVFGLPIFLVLIYFFMQFTKPDRFGRVDRHLLDADPDEDPTGSGDGEPNDRADGENRDDAEDREG